MSRDRHDHTVPYYTVLYRTVPYCIVTSRTVAITVAPVYRVRYSFYYLIPYNQVLKNKNVQTMYYRPFIGNH